jgi:type III restriction enzyme
LHQAVIYAGTIVIPVVNNNVTELQVDTSVFSMTSGTTISPDRVCKFRYSMTPDRNSKCDVINGIGRALGFKLAKTLTHSESTSSGSKVKYDLLGEITEKTQLTRRTALKILEGIEPGTFAKFRSNPEQFITESARLINEQKASVIVEHIQYDTLNERFDSSIFTENQTKEDFTKTTNKLSKHVYDYVVTDSQIERDFVADLDTSQEVVVYAKLPRGFFIPTPMGDYNPDWAIAFQEGTVKHVYFVAETKGSLSTLQLKGMEDAKIQCARKYFRMLNSEREEISYDVVTDYSELMQIVAPVSK